MNDPTDQPGKPEAVEALRTELLARLDDLSRELRRQGRASLAAQAAAEACLEAVKDPPAAPAAPPEAERWLRALLPTLDAIDRAVAQAAALRRPRPAPGRSVLQRLLAIDPPQDEARAAEIAALAQGLELLRPLTEQSLASLGVRIERRVGLAVDPTLHRVVETRGEEDPPRVVEVVRAGYWIEGACVREADVVATRQKNRREGRE